MGRLIALALLLVLAQTASASLPETMSYQGVLRDTSGSPVPDGTYDITFRLYDVESGGTALWAEEQSVTTADGIFGVTLGSLTPITLGFDVPYWLGVQVESDPELSPRVELAAAPYALRAKQADSARLELPYEASGTAVNPLLSIENSSGPAVVGLSGLGTGPGTAGVTGRNTSGAIVGGLAYVGDDLAPWGLYTNQNAYVEGTLRLPSGATVGHVLTSDAEGDASWQAPASTTDSDWTVSGSDMYSSVSGSVGIGTTTPERKLHIRDTVAGGVSYPIKIDNPENDAGTAVGVLFKVDSGTESRGKGGLVYERTDTWNRGSFHFLQDSGVSYANPNLADAVMTIDNGGNVGIGTTTPTELLQVAGVVHSTFGGFKFPDGSIQTSAGGGISLPYSGSTSASGYAFSVSNTGTGGGMYANAPSGTGLEATSGTGSGIWATSSSGDALHAVTYNGRGLYAEDADGKTVTVCDSTHGVTASNPLAGTSGDLAGPSHGVYGETSIASGSGVYGKHSGSGAAVYGNAPTGTGVEASSGTGSGVWATSSSGDALHAVTYNGRGLYAEDADGKTVTVCDPDFGVAAVNGASGTAGHVAGPNHGIYGETSASSGNGVYGKHNGSGAAVYGNAPSGTGVEASSGTGSGLWATSSSGDAVHAISAAGRAGYFEGGIETDGFELTTGATSGYVLTSDASGVGTWQPPVAGSDGDWVVSGSNIYSAVSGRVGIGTSSPAAKLEVQGPARITGLNWPGSGAGLELHYSSSAHKGYVQVYDRDSGTWGNLYLGNGLVGIGTGYPDVKLDVYSTTETAIQAQSTVGRGVDATGNDIGVRGAGATGVKGEGGSIGVHGVASGFAGLFEGPVQISGSAYITGDLVVSGSVSKNGGQFRIDHPLDPENKYLCHSFVESPDMMNIYNGNVVLDDNGEARVQLPEWFEALNMEFRYQLTCIGGHAPVYISDEIADNGFGVAGGTPGLKVSWQVTGIRHDDYANANRIQVEVDKD